MSSEAVMAIVLAFEVGARLKARGSAAFSKAQKELKERLVDEELAQVGELLTLHTDEEIIGQLCSYIK